MSSSRPTRIPDPDKWVSANKVDRPLPQRPLIDPRFRSHCGIATPPPSTSRKRAPSSAANPRPSSTSATKAKRGVVEVTPTAPQRSITSFFTPPTTGPSQKNKGKGKAHPTVQALKNDIHAERDWSPSARDASAVPSSLPRPRRPSPQRRYEDLLHTPGPEAPSSSLAPITQVPEEVLAMHRRLCGNDSLQPRALSPWRLDAGEVDEDELLDNAKFEREYKQQRQKEERVAKRKHMEAHTNQVIGGHAIERARKAKERRALGEFKSLAHLSSSSPREDRESSPSERTVLAPIALNIAPLGRHSSAIEGPVSERDDSWPKSKRPLLPPIRSRSRKKTSPFPSPKQSTPKKRRMSPRKVTPKKRRSPHHKVTPPKSRTPQKYTGQQETLFVLPDPPPRPVFEPLPAKPARQWQPVAMEAETLITWSMGGGYTLPPVPEASERTSNSVTTDCDDDESIDGSVSSQSFPHLVESASPVRLRSRKAASPTNDPLLEFNRGRSASPRSRSPSPMINLFPYSPEAPAKQPSNDTIPSSLPEEPGSLPRPSTPSPSPSPRKLVRRADQDFKRVGLFSSVADMQISHPPASAPKSRSASISARSPSARSSAKKGTQSKLEAFGYLVNNRRETVDFATPFSDEEDLDFGHEEPLFGSPSKSTKNSRLGPVPDAPPHPSLRSAGVREVKRRESAAMSRHRDQHRSQQPSGDRDSESKLIEMDSHGASDFEIPHMSSAWAIPAPSTNASSLEASDAPTLNRSTKQWWERLGERDELSL